MKKVKSPASIFNHHRRNALYHSKILVTLRQSILDPQGKAVEHGVHSLGYDRIRNVRIGKFVELDVDTASRDDAERMTREISSKLLANPVMEDFVCTIEEVKE